MGLWDRADAGDAVAMRWYRGLVSFGIVANMTFAVVALYAPQKIQDWLQLRRLDATIWLRNVGMLLVLVSMFNAGSARDPYRYPLYSYMIPGARLIAGFFFWRVGISNPHSSSERPQGFYRLAVFDTAMGLICGALLHKGLPAGSRLSLENIKAGRV